MSSHLQVELWKDNFYIYKEGTHTAVYSSEQELDIYRLPRGTVTPLLKMIKEKNTMRKARNKFLNWYSLNVNNTLREIYIDSVNHLHSTHASHNNHQTYEGFKYESLIQSTNKEPPTDKRT